MASESTDKITTDLFTLTVKSTEKIAGLDVVRVKTSDHYHRRRYSLERRAFLGFTNLLQKYLKKRPHIDFKHRFNLARPLVYLSPGVKAWSAYMPGGFATYHVHSPEVKKLKSGKRVDFVTRRLFRHAVDAIGLRSRAYVLTWLVHDYAKDKKTVNWLSLASGSGQPVFDTVDSLKSVDFNIKITDHDRESLDFAETVYGLERPHVRSINFADLDVLKPGAVAQTMVEMKADLVDAMGLFEYLEVDVAGKLITQIYDNLPVGGRFIFTNMSDANPHLDLHKRGLGWPGVIPRSVADVADILSSTAAATAEISVYAPSDKVYNIFEIKKVE